MTLQQFYDNFLKESAGFAFEKHIEHNLKNWDIKRIQVGENEFNITSILRITGVPFCT